MNNVAGTVAEVVRGAVRGSLHVDRSKLAPFPALRGSVGMAIPLVVGEFTGHLLMGVTAAIGALIGGFASLQGTYRSRAGIMLVATAGFALSALVGATVGHLVGPDIVLTALWGFVAGLQVAFGQASTIVGLQSVVGLVIFAQFHFSLKQAALQAVLVLAGGMLQVILVLVVWPLRRFPAERKALSVTYVRLALHARALSTDLSALLNPAHLDELRAVLADPQPMGNPIASTAFQALADQAERIRLELAGVARGRQRLGDTGESEAAQELAVLCEASANVLAEVAESLRLGRTARPRHEDQDRLRRAIDHLWLLSDGAKGWRRAVLSQASDGAVALSGQLRAIVSLSTVAAGEGPSPRIAPGPQLRSSRSSRSLRIRGRLAAAVSYTRDYFETFFANVAPTSEAFRHAVRVALALALAVAISHLFPLGHGYWLPLTVIIVLKPDFTSTFTRGVARSVGTLVGVGLVTLLLAGLRPPPAGLIIITVVLYAATITVLEANYAIFSACIASLVVSLLAFVGGPAINLAADRSFYTLLGATLAMAAYALWPTWERAVVPDRLATLVEANGRYGAAVLAAWANPTEANPTALHRARMDARLARSNAEASVERWLAEPTNRSQLRAETARGILAAVRRYVWGTLALHAQLPASGPPRPELHQLGNQVEAALGLVASTLRSGVSTGNLPRLRSTQVALATHLKSMFGRDDVEGLLSFEFDRQAVVIVSETDLIVNAVDTLAQLVGVPDPSDPNTHGDPRDEEPEN